MILDDALLSRAMRLTGLTEKTAVVHAGLEALISRASAQRLARLGGSDPSAEAPPRRRPATSPPATVRKPRAKRERS
jgi:Arc/MetJ family transcription regulator